MGPGGGKNGGEIIATGTPEEIALGNSPTAQYIAEELNITKKH
jgi:excinuclease ABC subunit A